MLRFYRGGLHAFIFAHLRLGDKNWFPWAILRLGITIFFVPPKNSAPKDTHSDAPSVISTDVLLIGGGIMSATLGALFSILQPEWKVTALEQLSGLALESSGPWNNAGTGHAALCELNYTQEDASGNVDISKALKISSQFRQSRSFWAALEDQGLVTGLNQAITAVPHLTFVRGQDNVAGLKRRFEDLVGAQGFEDLEYSADHNQIAQWVPLLMRGRTAGENVAATRSLSGTDVNFGLITEKLFELIRTQGGDVLTSHRVKSLKQQTNKKWLVEVDANGESKHFESRFVFVGAGGKALTLLQSAGVKEVRGYGGFPISGRFLRCTNPSVVSEHTAKVYGKADVGSPPMSVPHLDTRVIDGKHTLLFGPYAGFTPKFLKAGSFADFPKSIRPSNLKTLLAVGVHNLGLTWYLIKELAKGNKQRFKTLQDFMPSANIQDWELITAGQRVQIMKPDAKSGGKLEFGTEVITAEDRSIAGILGASPGASTAFVAMREVLQSCFPTEYAQSWEAKLASFEN